MYKWIDNTLYWSTYNFVKEGHPMITAGFWLKKVKDAKRVMATPEEIETFNTEILRHPTSGVHDLTQYPVTISKEKLIKLLDEQQFWSQKHYVKDELLGDRYCRRIQQEINIEKIGKVITLQYGFTVRRTNLRILPTTDFVTKCPGDYEFDRLQQTAVTAAQPVLILHVSLSGQWYFVQSCCATGWMIATDIAVANQRAEWITYATVKKFLVVTGNRLRLGFNPYFPELSELEFYMGDILPLIDGLVVSCVGKQSTVGNYIVKLPVRKSSGELDFKLALVPMVSDVRQGYLSYTKENVLRQAFKMQGDRYGWGGSFNSRDCSAFIMDVYRSFGFRLPRNTWEQMHIPSKSVDFAAKTVKERREVLSQLMPGTPLYFPGHVMLYLGQYKNDFYVIHAIAECGAGSCSSSQNSLEIKSLHNVMVTPLSLLRTNGQSLLEGLTVAKLFCQS